MRYRGNDIWLDERTNEPTGQCKNTMPSPTMSDNEGIKTENDDDDDNNVDRQGRSWPAGFGVRAPPPSATKGRLVRFS